MLKNSGTQYLDNNMTEIVPYNTDLISSIKVSIMLRHGTLCNTQSGTQYPSLGFVCWSGQGCANCKV